MGWLSLRPMPVPTLLLRPGTDVTMVGEVTEDTTDMVATVATTDTPTDTDTVIWENGRLMPNPRLMLMPLLGIMVDTTVTPDTTVMDTVWDTDTDIPMPVLTATTILERGPLMPNPRLTLLPRPMPNPGTDTTVDTMAIPTEATTDMAVMAVMVDVTGGRL